MHKIRSPVQTTSAIENLKRMELDKMAQQIREIMSTDIVSVSPEQSIQEAASLMKQNDVGSLPVVENGQVIGIITDRDIALRSTSEGKETTIPVRECMTENPTVASPSMDVHEAARIMAEKQIRRLPVVENGQLIGMVAIGDLATEEIYQNEAGEALSQISENTDHTNA